MVNSSRAKNASTYNDSRDRVEYDVLEPGVDVVEDEEREERRGVDSPGLDDEEHDGA